MIDHDGDGVVSEQDLRHLLPSLGAFVLAEPYINTHEGAQG